MRVRAKAIIVGALVAILAALVADGERPAPTFGCAPGPTRYEMRCEAHYVWPETPTWEVYVEAGVDGCGAWQTDIAPGLVAWVNRSRSRQPFAVVMKLRHRVAATAHFDGHGRRIDG